MKDLVNNSGVSFGTRPSYKEDISIERYNELKEEGKVGKPTSPITYNIETPNVEVQELSEDAKKELAYLGKSAEVGFKKGIDLAVAIDQGIQNLENPLTVDTPTKQWAMDAIAERDAFYVNNKEVISGGTQFIGGMIETMSNPIEIGINVVEGFLTGGASIWAKLGMTALYNGVTTIGIENIYSKRYTGEFLGLEDNVKVGLQSAVLSGIMEGVGVMKTRLVGDTNIKGDTTVNVRNAMDNEGDAFAHSGFTKQQVYTNNIENMTTELDPYIARAKDITEGTQAKVEVETTIKDNKKGRAYRPQESIYGGDYDLTKTTVLSRRDINSRNIYDNVRDLDLTNEDDIATFRLITGLSEDINIPKNINKGDAVSLDIFLSRKGNDVIETLIEDIRPTVDYAYENWKFKDTLNPLTDIKIVVGSYDQIDMALNKIDAKYQTQKMYSQTEYLNIINRGNAPATLNEFLNGIGKDGNNVAKEWINGMKNPVLGDSNNFLKRAYDDAIILDELNMKTSLYDIEGFNVFQEKFGKHFDENGNIILNDDLLDTLSKLKPESEDYHTIVSAMKDNTHEWVEFIATAKDKLEGHYIAQEVKRVEKQANSIVKKMDSERKSIEKEISNAKKDLKDLSKEIKAMEKDGLTDTKDYHDLVAKAKENLVPQIKKLEKKLDKWTETKYKDYVKQLEELDDFVAMHSNVQIHDKVLAKRLEKNRKFIDTEYANIIRGIDVKNKEPKVWKAEVANAIAKNKRKLAIESIKINQVVNKQKMLGSVQRYFTDSVYDSNIKEIKFTPKGKEEFINDILGFYQDGTFKRPKGVTKNDLIDPTDATIEKLGEHFKKFVVEYKKTRQFIRKTGEYKSLGELREFFNRKGMPEFFTNYRNGEYIKSNAEIVRDIFDKNTSQSARFIQFGSTSPFAMKNRFNNIKTVATRKHGTELADVASKVYEIVKNRGINMLEHTQNIATRTPEESWKSVNKIAQSLLTTKYLAWTGFEELTGQNYAMALFRAQKYTGLKGLTDYGRYGKLKLMKAMSDAEVPNKYQTYTLAQLKHDFDLSDVSKKSTGNKFIDLVDNYNDLALIGQKLSDQQLKRVADSISTATLHNLPEYAKLTNEMRSLLTVNGITKDNYDAFKGFAKSHIEEHGLRIDNDILSRYAEHSYEPYAEALRNINYTLTDYIGDVKSNNKFDDVKFDAFTSWSNMFRSFSRAVNRDNLKRFYYTTNNLGVGVSRISEFKKGNYSNAFSGAFGTGVIGVGLMGVGGMARDLSKEYIRSSRTEEQRLALIKTKLTTNVLSTILSKTPYGEVFDFVKGGSKNIIYTEGKQLYDIFATFTDDEKQVYGTNIEEGTKLVGEWLTQLVGRAVSNNIRAIAKDDIESLGKVYELDKEQQAKYETLVRLSVQDLQNNKEKLLGLVEEEVDKQIRIVRAERDYAEGDMTSFELLPQDKKELIQTVIKTNNIQNEEDFKIKATVAVANMEGESDEELVEFLAEDNPLEEIDTRETVNSVNSNKQIEEDFNNMSALRKDVFNKIMTIKGKKNITTKDKIDFMNNLSEPKTIEEILRIYNIPVEVWVQ